MAAFSAAGRLAAGFANSRAGRAGGRALAAGAGAYVMYKAARRALTETVPYAVVANGRGRRRFAPPAWPASCLPPGMQPVSVIAADALCSILGRSRLSCKHPKQRHMPA